MATKKLDRDSVDEALGRADALAGMLCCARDPQGKDVSWVGEMLQDQIRTVRTWFNSAIATKDLS